MNKAPAFQFYAQDFLTGVMYLTNEEVGIYIKMLAKQWTDGNIPIKRLGFLVGYDWDKLSDELKSKFTEKDGFLVNLRLEKEREKSISFREKQRENGKKGGRPPKKNKLESFEDKEKEPKPLIKVNPNKNQKKPLEDEDENEVEVEDEIEYEVEIYPTFEDFWDEYDKKTGKEKCIKLWGKIKQDDREKIMQHIPNYKFSQPDKKYRKNPETYLNNKSWNDEIIITQNGNRSSSNQRTDAELKRDASNAIDRLFGS